jgi:hypothetical protein
MNTTPLEDQVHDALHRRVDPLQRAPFTVGDVRTRARRIQRRRAIAAGAAVAAVLAVAVPVGLTMVGPTQRSDVLPAPQPPAPSVTGTQLVDPRSAPVVDDLSLPIIDVVASTLITDGETIPLPGTFDTVTPYLDGWAAEAVDEGVLTIQFLTSDLTVEDPGAPSGGLVVSPDGQRIAWTEYTGSRWQVVTGDVAGAEGQVSTKFPPGPESATVRPVGFVSATQVIASQNDGNGVETTYLADGSSPVEVPGLIRARSASPVTGMVAGLTSSEIEGSCSAVVDGTARTGAPAWETCDYQLGAFSPDGGLVVGFAAQGDGYGSRTVSILDAATGETVVDFEVAAKRRQVVGVNDLVAWEDEQTLAVTLNGADGKQYVVRLGADGTVERVAVDTPSDPDLVPLRFAEVR